MKRLWLAALALTALVVTACSGGGGTPKAVVPEASHDFGEVPTVADMSNMADARVHEFVVRNEGTGDLKLGDIQVKVLDGC